MSDGNHNNQGEALDIHHLPELLTPREVAELFRISVLTLKKWGRRGKIIPIRINTRGDRRYRRRDVFYMMGMSEYA